MRRKIGILSVLAGSSVFWFGGFGRAADFGGKPEKPGFWHI